MTTAAATSQFPGVDFYDMDSLLSEEERAVRDTVRAWVDDNLMPVIGDAYIKGEFPKQLIPGMAELGFFGANLPEEYGCAGLNNVAYGLIMQELERGDSGIRSFASVQGGAGDVSRSTPSAPRSRRSTGCRGWRRARRSAASA